MNLALPGLVPAKELGHLHSHTKEGVQASREGGTLKGQPEKERSERQHHAPGGSRHPAHRSYASVSNLGMTVPR